MGGPGHLHACFFGLLRGWCHNFCVQPTLLIFGKKCEEKFVPDDRMTHVAAEHVHCTGELRVGGRAGILTDS